MAQVTSNADTNIQLRQEVEHERWFEWRGIRGIFAWQKTIKRTDTPHDTWLEISTPDNFDHVLINGVKYSPAPQLPKEE